MNTFQDILRHSHSGLRWAILALLLVAIARAFSRKNSGVYDKSDKLVNLFTMISMHMQLLLGLVLYIMNIGTKIKFDGTFMSNAQSRILGMEHALLMIIAIVLITIGRKKAEKAEAPADKHKKIALWFTIVLVVVLAAIPWPFRNIGTGWF
jgi:ABC-type xylose transport system permease subunit